MAIFVAETEYRDGLITISPRNNQSSDTITITAIPDVVAPPLFRFDGTVGPYKIYRRGSDNKYYEADVRFTVNTVIGGHPSGSSTNRVYVYLTGTTYGSYAGTYYLMDSTKLFYVEIRIENKTTSNCYSITYNDDGGTTFSSTLFPKDCLSYGVPLNITNWAGHQQGYHSGSSVEGKIVGGRFYAFDHWNTNLGNYPLNGFIALINPTDGMYLDANFSSSPYTFTVSLTKYNGNETTPTVTETNVVSGNTYTAPSSADTRPHYVFKKWNESRIYGTLSFGQTLTVTYSDLNIKSQWDGAQYTVSYNINTTGVTPSSVNSTTVTYPDTITLPSLSKSNYAFSGWAFSGTTYLSGQTYKPTSDTTFTSVFVPLTYRVIFKDADGTTESTTQYANFGTAVNIPSAPSRPAFNFKWWAVDGSTTEAISKTATTYSPPSVSSNQQTFTFIRIYSYTRTLKGTTALDGNNRTVSADYPNAVSLPTQANHTSDMELSGYRIKGWSTSNQTPSIYTNPTAQYTAQYTPSLTDTATIFYIAWIPATLESITLASRLLIKVGVPVDISDTSTPPNSPTVTINPPDWQGMIEWHSNDNNIHYTVVSNGKHSATVTGVAETSDSTRTITAKAPNQTWNYSQNSGYTGFNTTAKYIEHYVFYNGVLTYVTEFNKDSLGITPGTTKAYDYPSSPSGTYSYIQSNAMSVDVSDYLQIDFWTRNDKGESVQYGSWFIDSELNQLEWEGLDGTVTFAEYADYTGFDSTYDYVGFFVDVSGVKTFVTVANKDSLSITAGTTKAYLCSAYPQNPVRQGYSFIGWTDADGTFVDYDHPLDHPAVCTASWMRRYEPIDRDVLILQEFNGEGNAIMLELDAGVVTSVNENFTNALSIVPTPTMSSENTFITDLNCTESIPFKFMRKHPIDFNDDTDDSRRWSNGKWIEELRRLVDRWQSATDGIKVLYIPSRMRMTTVLGRYVCYGSNYDLLGYCLPRIENGEENLGLLYDEDTKVLVGYNAIISTFTDTSTAGTNEIIEVSMSVVLGGMVSQYQDWKDNLLMGDRS